MMRHVSHQTVNNEQTNQIQTLADGVTSPTVTSPPAEYTEIASPSQTEKVGFPPKIGSRHATPHGFPPDSSNYH